MGNNNKNVVVDDFYERMLSGVSFVAQPLRSSFCSDNRAHDSNGFTITSEIKLKDNLANLGIKIIRSASKKLYDKFKNGVTMSILLSEAILSNIIKNRKELDPKDLVLSFRKSMIRVVDFLRKSTHQLNSDEEIFQVATSNAFEDENMGQTVLDAIHYCGKDGFFKAFSSKESPIGISKELGYIFLYDKIALRTEYLEKPLILIINKEIKSIHEFLNIFVKLSKDSIPLIIICRGISSDVLKILEVNKKEKLLNSVILISKEFDELSLASKLGATIVDKIKGDGLEILGSVDRAYFYENSVAFIKKNRAFNEKIFTINLYRGRDRNESIIKQDNSWRYTKSSVMSGVIAGGGSALLFASMKPLPSRLSKIDAITTNALNEALAIPIKILISKSKRNEPNTLQEIIKKGLPYGLNIKKNNIEDMIKAGIVDSYDLMKEVLNSVSSSVESFLLSKALPESLKR